MIPPNQPCRPEIHAAARRMAMEFVEIVSAILMENERQEALKQAYLIARDGLDRMRECK